MKKALLTMLALACFASFSMGTVNLTISNTTAVLTNLTISGNNTQRLLWGVIVDGLGDGFQGLVGNGTYVGNATATPGPQTITTAQSLRITDGVSTTVTDDVLYLATTVFATAGTGDGSTGLAKPTSLIGLALGGNVTLSDAFAIVWFDITDLQLGQTSVTASPNGNVTRLEAGLRYGALTTSGFSTPTLNLPASDPATVNYATNFLGADTTRNATFTLKTVIPEPSSALLLIGAGSLLVARRRRES